MLLTRFVPCEASLIFFILKCYPLFCVNFLYSKFVFHQIRVASSRGHRTLISYNEVHVARSAASRPKKARSTREEVEL